MSICIWRMIQKRMFYALAISPVLMAVMASSVVTAQVNPGRTDFAFMKTVYAGNWGPWSEWQYCPGERNNVVGVRIRAEERFVGDNTGINAFEFICQKGERIKPHGGHWGVWSEGDRCGADQQLYAFVLYSIKPAGDHDDYGAYGLKYTCVTAQGVAGVSDSGKINPCKTHLNPCPSWDRYNKQSDHHVGQVTGEHNGQHFAICGLRVRVEKPQGDGDDTALNGLELAYCNFTLGDEFLTMKVANNERFAVRYGNRISIDTDGDGVLDKNQFFGDGNSEDEYLFGDWDGNGTDDVAIRRGNQILMDTNADGQHDSDQRFGNGDEEYLVGNWDGIGGDNIAIRRGNHILFETNGDGQHDSDQRFGNGDEEYLVGNWDGIGGDNIAIRRGNHILFETNGDGQHDSDQRFGNGYEQYLVGNWDGVGGDNIAIRVGNQVLMDTNGDGAHDLNLNITVSQDL